LCYKSFSTWWGKKEKKKGKKKANATSPKEFFGKNGPKSLITWRGFLFLFLFFIL
jgi:hypothetical protein